MTLGRTAFLFETYNPPSGSAAAPTTPTANAVTCRYCKGKDLKLSDCPKKKPILMKTLFVFFYSVPTSKTPEVSSAISTPCNTPVVRQQSISVKPDRVVGARQGHPCHRCAAAQPGTHSPWGPLTLTCWVQIKPNTRYSAARIQQGIRCRPSRRSLYADQPWVSAHSTCIPICESMWPRAWQSARAISWRIVSWWQQRTLSLGRNRLLFMSQMWPAWPRLCRTHLPTLSMTASPALLRRHVLHPLLDSRAYPSITTGWWEHHWTCHYRHHSFLAGTLRVG